MIGLGGSHDGVEHTSEQLALICVHSFFQAWVLEFVNRPREILIYRQIFLGFLSTHERDKPRDLVVHAGYVFEAGKY
jgi:hypothetical protein